MEVTFLVKLDLPDSSESTLAGEAELIQDALESDGIPIISVVPWARPTQPGSAEPSPLSLLPTIGSDENTKQNINKLNLIQ